MIELNCERHLEAFKWIKARPFVAVLHLHPFFYTNKAFRGILILNPGGLHQKHEGPCTPIHYRDFRGADIHIGIVYPEARQGGQQVLDGRDTRPTTYQGGRQGCITHVLCPGRDLHGGIHVNAPKHNACVYGGGSQCEVHLFSSM